MNAAQQSAVSYYLGKGLSKDSACGIVAVLTVESSMNPAAIGDGGTSYGLAQWHLTRRDDLHAFATKYALDSTQANTQLQFVLTEAANSYPQFWATLTSAASTYHDVVEVMVNTYEIPADKEGEIAKALPIAADLMASVGPTPVPPPTPTPTPSPPLDYDMIAKLVSALLKLLQAQG